MANQQDQGHLLTCAESVYAWVYMYPQSLQHEVNVEQATTKWKKELRQAWPLLLPSERRAVADSLLGAAAEWAVTAQWNVQRIDFDAVHRHACPFPHWGDEHNLDAQWDALRKAVDGVQMAYRVKFPTRDTRTTSRAPEQVWAAWFKGHKNKPRGVSLDKFARLGPAAAQILVSKITAIAPEVEAVETSTMARALLPDPFPLLEEVQLLAETAEQRLFEYAGLASIAATVYVHDQQPSRIQPRKSRTQVMEEAYLLAVSPAHLDPFEHRYTPLEQRRLVDNARERVYVAAQSFIVRRHWEDADQLAHDLVAPFLHEPLQQQHANQMSGSSRDHPYQVDSLAHSSSAPRMSPYYARKYYSSSSLARQARLI